MQENHSDIDILIVDDVSDNRRLLARMLKRRGYRVEAASNGLEALELTRKLLPSLILLDVAMPGMDGYQVCQTLKADEKLSEIPVIFLSAHSEQVDKLRGFQAGGVDYVTKPFHFHEVAARVAAHIELFRQKKENEELRRKEQTYFERVNQLKNELIHTMTHDLKNPLTSIKLSISLLQRILKLQDDSKEMRYFGKIEDDLDRMLILISKLLNLAYIETSSSIHMTRVNISDFLTDCANKAGKVLKTNNIQTKIVSYASGTTKSVFDPDQVSSVLEKILTEMANRVEAGGMIEISYWVVGDEVLVSISDQAMHDQRIPPTLDPELPPEGIDPSFSILTAVFERHGGRIWQDRHTGDYRFTLPFLNDADAEELGVTFTQYQGNEAPSKTVTIQELINNS
ncbi:MAG: hybrid sensor histidine kinase/response regulator [Chloroflexota bacterium]